MLNGNKLQPKIDRKPSKIAKWWNKSGYKVLYVIAFPIAIGSLIHDRIKYAPSNYTMDDMPKIHKWLDKCLPKVIKHNCKDLRRIVVRLSGDCECNFTSDYMQSSGWIPRRYRHKFWVLNHEVKAHMWDNYHIKGYDTIIAHDRASWKKVDPFGLIHYNDEHDKAVFFQKR